MEPTIGGKRMGCDVCLKDTSDPALLHGQLEGEPYLVRLCPVCFALALADLRRLRATNTLFDESLPSEADFGWVVPVTVELLERVQRLVKGVAVDLQAPLRKDD
ncbi:TPA: hypothetical protein ACXJNE_003823 [Pseudomonas aeruginosa]|nr:hypothetical protein [Pseudomonas aeruginosa]HCJ6265376.1 hypothetical protein [Pseudomonas aeruginosa]